MNSDEKDYLISNGFYDKLRFLSDIFLPALGTLYFTVAQIWGLPNVEEVVGTGAAVTVFLGALIRISDKSYQKSTAKYDGVMVVTVNEETGNPLYSLEADSDMATWPSKDEVRFKVST